MLTHNPKPKRETYRNVLHLEKTNSQLKKIYTLTLDFHWHAEYFSTRMGVFKR